VPASGPGGSCIRPTEATQSQVPLQALTFDSGGGLVSAPLRIN